MLVYKTVFVEAAFCNMLEQLGGSEAIEPFCELHAAVMTRLHCNWRRRKQEEPQITVMHFAPVLDETLKISRRFCESARMLNSSEFRSLVNETEVAPVVVPAPLLTTSLRPDEESKITESVQATVRKVQETASILGTYLHGEETGCYGTLQKCLKSTLKALLLVLLIVFVLAWIAQFACFYWATLGCSASKLQGYTYPGGGKNASFNLLPAIHLLAERPPLCRVWTWWSSWDALARGVALVILILAVIFEMDGQGGGAAGQPGAAQGMPGQPDSGSPTAGSATMTQVVAQVEVQQDMIIRLQAALEGMRREMDQNNARLQRAEEERSIALRLASQAQSSQELVDTKGVGQPFKFSGRPDQDFAEWDHKMKTFLRAKFGVEIDEVLSWPETEKGDRCRG
eukprot:s1265_g14.t1